MSVWKDCGQGIYLDVGTNYAAQIRKLYTPELFPNATVLPLFDKYFGTDRRRVCSAGFEPNPVHEEYLSKVNAHFQVIGYQSKIFTRTAVLNKNIVNASFFRVRTIRFEVLYMLSIKPCSGLHGQTRVGCSAS